MVVIGAPQSGASPAEGGKTYVFERQQGGVWKFQANLTGTVSL